MPCYYTGSALGDAKLSAAESSKKVTELTDILCSTFRALERNGSWNNIKDQLTTPAVTWWEHHKAVDAEKQRVAREEQNKRIIAAAARNKLSDEERAALGI